MTEKRFELAYETNRQNVIWWAVRDGDITLWKEETVATLNELYEEIEELKQALKNSYINEICENCKHGHYWISETFGYGLEGEFKCTKKHFGNDHWKCDGLTECDDFELKIER